MIDPKKYVRRNILALTPYSTARDEFKGGDISIWLDANESPYPHSVRSEALEIDINRYPDPHQRKLKSVISKLKGMPTDTIFVGGAGSDEAIDLVYRIFCTPGVDNVVAISPSYGVYSVAAAINDVEYREVMLDENFEFSTETLLDATDSHTKVIWICSPNNPTANAFSPSQILDVAKRFDGMVVLDEAYVDFSEKGSLIHEVTHQPNLIVLQTFSKAWGMASLRLGMAFACPEIASIFAMVKYPYNVNGPTQQEVILQLERSISSEIEEILVQRTYLIDELKNLDIVKRIYHSDANFVLVKFENAKVIYDYLVANGLIVRNRSSLPGCDQCLRLTIGTPLENQRLVELLKKYRNL